jgi:hypothetical protein
MNFGILLSQYQVPTNMGGWVLFAQGGRCFFFFSFQFSHFATSKSGDHPQEDLAKSDYKRNREVETLECLSYFGE